VSSVLVAMSGGVDSSVAAALMVARGHDVIGVTLKLWEGPDGRAPTAGCCTVADAEDARRAAATLDIPYYVLDATGPFRTGVVDPFVGAYLRGRTPNPCVECNRTLKFSHLLAQADEFGCELLVTGHHARVGFDGGRWRLLRGVDRAKDQSYVLSMLGQAELERVRLPVGDFDKPRIRRIATDLDLRTAAKPDSQDICFVGDGDYREFVRRVAAGAEHPGPIVDRSGRVLGAHRGVVDVTVGQRRGLGLADGHRRYVVEVRPETATVVVGDLEDLAVSSLELEGVTWVHDPPSGPVEVQYRAHGAPVAAVLEAGEVLHLGEPQYGVAPGQTATVYRGDEVLGGGVIARTG
jgi:tRNA-uridine 2-sulfurtransferase